MRIMGAKGAVCAAQNMRQIDDDRRYTHLSTLSTMWAAKGAKRGSLFDAFRFERQRVKFAAHFAFQRAIDELVLLHAVLAVEG